MDKIRYLVVVLVVLLIIITALVVLIFIKRPLGHEGGKSNNNIEVTTTDTLGEKNLNWDYEALKSLIRESFLVNQNNQVFNYYDYSYYSVETINIIFETGERDSRKYFKNYNINNSFAYGFLTEHTDQKIDIIITFDKTLIEGNDVNEIMNSSLIKTIVFLGKVAEKGERLDSEEMNSINNIYWIEKYNNTVSL